MKHLKPAVILLLWFTLITGVVYPLLVTAIGLGIFPDKARGSLLTRNGQAIGSRLIGQPFDDARYFQGRPSATTPPDNAAASTGSNLGPTNPALLTAIRERVAALRAANPGATGAIPVDLVTTSASGLDPHLSPAAALYQVARVAQARGLDPDTVRRLVLGHVERRQFGLLGEPRVNVLELNLALDGTLPLPAAADTAKARTP